MEGLALTLGDKMSFCYGWSQVDLWPPNNNFSPVLLFYFLAWALISDPRPKVTPLQDVIIADIFVPDVESDPNPCQSYFGMNWLIGIALTCGCG